MERALDAFFAAGRAVPPETPEALLNRVSTAAEAARPVEARRPKGWLARLGAGFGGWGSLGGMVTATAVGVWIGYAGIGGIGTATNTLLGTGDDGIVDLLPAVDDFALAAGEG